MQTYTHYVMTAVLNRQLKKQDGNTEPTRLPPVRTGWLMVGSVLPDLPLIVLAIACIILDRLAGNQFDPGNQAALQQTYTGYLFDYMFFHEPWVIAVHNLFHAPLLVIGYILVGYWAWQRQKQWGGALFWLGCAGALHTAIDIPLHYDDGPLLFFPFEWQTRFHSPVSYWDPARYGIPFAIFEHLLLLGMLVYLGIGWWTNRRMRNQSMPNEQAMPNEIGG